MLRFPPRRILVAVDVSRASVLAWRAAREIAGRFGSKLEAVWCDEVPPPDLSGFGHPAALRAMRRKILERLEALLGPGAHVHAVGGNSVRLIRRLARERGFDLIVLGTNRRRGVARWVMGSVSESLVREAPCPVLVVSRAWRAPRWVLAPINDAPYARRGLFAAGVVARAYKARLAPLSVAADAAAAASAENLLRARVAQLPAPMVGAVKPSAEVRQGDPVREILRAEKGRDLVVLTAHRKSLLGDWVLGTTVERVLRHSRASVLAVPSR